MLQLQLESSLQLGGILLLCLHSFPVALHLYALDCPGFSCASQKRCEISSVQSLCQIFWNFTCSELIGSTAAADSFPFLTGFCSPWFCFSSADDSRVALPCSCVLFGVRPSLILVTV